MQPLRVDKVSVGLLVTHQSYQDSDEMADCVFYLISRLIVLSTGLVIRLMCIPLQLYQIRQGILYPSSK